MSLDVLVLFGVLLTACSTNTNSTIDDELRALDQHPEVAVTIRMGTEYFRAGRIAVTVRGDGSAMVEQVQAGRRTQYRAQLAPARVNQIGALLARSRFALPRTSTLPRPPDDTPLDLSVQRGGAPATEAHLWYGDRYRDRDLDAIVALGETLVLEVSGGKLGSAL